METRQLEYFVAVAEQLSFTRAAQQVFAVQSTISAAVRSLEDELGTALFERSTKHVALTAAGEQLLPQARAAIEAIDRVRSSVALTSAGIRGRLRVGIFTNLAALDLPGLFGEYHARYPLVDLQLTASPAGSTGFTEEVRHGRLDVAFMGLPLADLVGFNVLEVSRSRFVLIVPHDHPFAKRGAVPLSEAAGERFIDSPEGFGNRVVLDRALARAGLARTIGTVSADLGDIPRFVAAGLGIAIAPEALVPATVGTVVVPLAGDPLDSSLSLITRAHPSPAAIALLELMGQHTLAT